MITLAVVVDLIYLHPKTFSLLDLVKLLSLGVSSPSRKSPLTRLPPPSPKLFKSHGPPPSSSFRRSAKIVEGRTNYTKFPFSNAEEKHVDPYMVMSTIRNKTRTMYSKEVS